LVTYFTKVRGFVFFSSRLDFDTDNDPASFAIAYQLVKIAQNLPKIASPVEATGTRLTLVTN